MNTIDITHMSTADLDSLLGMEPEVPRPASMSPTIRKLLQREMDDYNRCELSECGIGYLRDYADYMGWDREQLGAFIKEVLDASWRKRCTPDLAGWEMLCKGHNGYNILACRAARLAAFAQLVGRGAI